MVQATHQHGSGLVFHLPVAGDDSSRAGMHEGPDHADKSLTLDRRAKRGVATAEDDQVDRETQAVDVMQGEEAVDLSALTIEA